MGVPLKPSLLRALPLAAVLAAAGCVHVPSGPPIVDEVEVGGASFRVVALEGDAGAARQVLRALAVAAPRAQRFVPLVSQVTLTLHPSHEDLEKAVDREGYDWLRAWARQRTVDLQSPRTWGLWGAGDREVEELLAHELTHCAMFQAAPAGREEGSWVLLDVPRWFAEGMASVAAGQGHRRASVEKLREHWSEVAAGAGDGWLGSRLAQTGGSEPEPRGDPLLDPDPLYRERADLVYGAAHHAFAALVAKHGEDAIRRIFEHVREGSTFAAAFRREIGVDPEAFADGFRRDVVAGKIR